MSKKSGTDIQTNVSEKFPIGSKHSVRILDYNHLSRLYICTVEQALLKEKNFSSNDLNIGQLLNVKVDAVKPEGLVVDAGHIKCFVPNLYISNIEYSDNVKRKYREGMKLKAR